MLASWSISKRINAGFALSLLVLIGLGAFAFFAVSRIGGIFVEYRDAAAQSQLVRDYEEDLLESRLASLNYQRSRDPEFLEEMRSNVAEIVDDTLGDRLFAGDSALMAARDRVLGHARDYAANIDRIAAYYKQRDALVAVLADLGPKTRKILTGLRQDNVAADNPQGVALAAEVQEALLLGRFYAERFLLTNRPADFERSLSELNKAQATADRMAVAVGRPDIQGVTTTVIENLSTYRETLMQVRAVIVERNALMDEMFERLGPEMQADLEALVEGECCAHVEDDRAYRSTAIAAVRRTLTDARLDDHLVDIDADDRFDGVDQRDAVRASALRGEPVRHDVTNVGRELREHGYGAVLDRP